MLLAKNLLLNFCFFTRGPHFLLFSSPTKKPTVEIYKNVIICYKFGYFFSLNGGYKVENSVYILSCLRIYLVVNFSKL